MKHYLSLGAGVQSSTMALMAARGEIHPMPDAAIFADTQAEPRSVYKWLEWLEAQLPFPVHRVSKGSLEAGELDVRVSKKTRKRYLKGSIPAFVKQADGGMGILGRKCTSDFKIIPIQQKVRELTGLKRGGKGIVVATMWIGISLDEYQRMKPSRVDYIVNEWPLIKKRMTRADCIEWMLHNGYPEPPRSSCRFCPFHGDEEWLRLKTNEPDEFTKACDFEKRLQLAAMNQDALRGVPFLHGSGIPLGEVEFRDKKQASHSQLTLWNDECEGMCGV